jgi:predicted deacetylase
VFSNSVLLASIHDVSPRFERQVDHLLDLLRRHVGDRLAMLVVPNHWGNAPLIPGSSFATRLRGWADDGIEMLLHGFYHRDEARHDDGADRLRARFMTAGEGEFLGLSRSAAAERIKEGRALVENIIGRPVAGFVAPAWLYGTGANEALRECSIGIAEDHWRVWSPTSGDRLARGPVITWASRTPARLRSSLLAAAALRRSPQTVLRVGVHPGDCGHAAILKSIDATMNYAAARRTAASYSDLLS